MEIDRATECELIGLVAIKFQHILSTHLAPGVQGCCLKVSLAILLLLNCSYDHISNRNNSGNLDSHHSLLLLLLVVILWNR